MYNFGAVWFVYSSSRRRDGTRCSAAFGVFVVPLAAWVLSKGNPRAWSTLLLTNMSSNNSFSNAATFVGRYISFLNKTEKATNKPLVIAYIISRNQENMSWNVMMERKNLWCSGRNNSSGWCANLQTRRSGRIGFKRLWKTTPWEESSKSSEAPTKVVSRHNYRVWGSIRKTQVSIW